MIQNDIHINDECFELLPTQYDLVETLEVEGDIQNCEIILTEEDELHSNTGGADPVSAIANAVSQISNTVGVAIESIPAVKKELKARCNKRPRIGKRRKAIYNACRERFYNEIAQEQERQFGASSSKLALEKAKLQLERDKFSSSSSRGLKLWDKETGLSQGAKIGIGLGVAGLVGATIYFLVKKAK